MRKGKVVAVLSASLLAVGVLGGTALAHWGPGGAEAVYEKIAEELGSDQSTVSDAYATASQEARDAAIAAKLARLVENGVLTQEEADSIQAWYDSAPEAIDKLPIGRGHGRADLERVAEILGVDVETLTDASEEAREAVAIEQFQAKLDAAVVDGRITQGQADEMIERFESRVEVGNGFGHHGRGHHGMRGFGPMPRFEGMRHDFGGFWVPDSDEPATEDTTTNETVGETA